jgi:myosin heavy subunit
MLPDPKKVARALKRTVLKSKAERQREAEIERDVQVRMAKTRIRQHISRQEELIRRFKGLAKKALSLNDEARFRQAGKQMLTAQKDIQRWEKYLLSLEMLEARREQVRASVELMQAVRAMSESLEDMAQPGKLGELQMDLEKGLANAASLDERMELMMGMMDSALQVEGGANEDDLAGLEASLLDEIAAQEASAFDAGIESGLAHIRQELKDK